MTPHDIVKAVFPDADKDLTDHVLWGRTPFPVATVNARSIYKAAHRFKRACDNGIRLCDWCDNIADAGKYTCKSCSVILDSARID